MLVKSNYDVLERWGSELQSYNWPSEVQWDAKSHTARKCLHSVSLCTLKQAFQCPVLLSSLSLSLSFPKRHHSFSNNPLFIPDPYLRWTDTKFCIKNSILFTRKPESWFQNTFQCFYQWPLMPFIDGVMGMDGSRIEGCVDTDNVLQRGLRNAPSSTANCH